MTGFGSAEGKVLGGRLSIEIRSVNHRYFNPQLKLPFELGGVEGPLRERLRHLLERGHVTVSARWIEAPQREAAVALDLARARQLVAAAKELKKRLKLKGEVDLAFVARQPDVLNAHQDGSAPAQWTEVEPIAERAVQELIGMRAREGAALAAELGGRLGALEQAAGTIEQRAPERLTAELARLKKAVAELAAGVQSGAQRLAAPSGGGKTTIARELRTRAPDSFGYSVSATTRKARPAERDGEAYHFLTRDEFERRREAGEFLESAEYAGELYGTLRSEVERVLRGGKHVVLDVEVTGARQVRKAYPRPASVVLFVIPPSPRVLIERLRKRRTESEAELSQRIDIATREVETARREIGDVYDRVLVNDDLETAVREVIDLVQSGERGVAQRAPGDMASLLSDFVRQLTREAAQLKQSTGRSR